MSNFTPPLFDNGTMVFFTTDEFEWKKEMNTFYGYASDLKVDNPADKIFMKNPKTGNRKVFYLKSTVRSGGVEGLHRKVASWKYEANNGLKVTIINI